MPGWRYLASRIELVQANLNQKSRHPRKIRGGAILVWFSSKEFDLLRLVSMLGYPTRTGDALRIVRSTILVVVDALGPLLVFFVKEVWVVLLVRVRRSNAVNFGNQSLVFV